MNSHKSSKLDWRKALFQFLALTLLFALALGGEPWLFPESGAWLMKQLVAD